MASKLDLVCVEYVHTTRARVAMARRAGAVLHAVAGGRGDGVRDVGTCLVKMSL